QPFVLEREGAGDDRDPPASHRDQVLNSHLRRRNIFHRNGVDGNAVGDSVQTHHGDSRVDDSGDLGDRRGGGGKNQQDPFNALRTQERQKFLLSRADVIGVHGDQ